MGTGSPPDIWSNIMAEMMVSDFPAALAFWTGPMGFAVAFTRPAQKLACLTRPEGAQIMVCERDGDWETGPLEPPYGRGAILQVYVADVLALHAAFTELDHPFFVPLREKWRDWGDRLGGQREFLVQDPDGYLVMVAQRHGTRPRDTP